MDHVRAWWFQPEEGNYGTHAYHLPARRGLFLDDAVHLGTTWTIGLGDNPRLNPFHFIKKYLVNMNLIYF